MLRLMRKLYFPKYGRKEQNKLFILSLSRNLIIFLKLTPEKGPNNLFSKRFRKKVFWKKGLNITKFLKGIAHVRDKQQFWSNATVSDAIFFDLPRLRKMQRRDSAAERQATVFSQSRGVSISCCLSLLLVKAQHLESIWPTF